MGEISRYFEIDLGNCECWYESFNHDASKSFNAWGNYELGGNLESGSIERRNYISLVLLHSKIEPTGLEGVLAASRARLLETNVTIYECSILQPAREGKWGGILFYSNKIYELEGSLNGENAEKLGNLIKSGDIASLRIWYDSVIQKR